MLSVNILPVAKRNATATVCMNFNLIGENNTAVTKSRQSILQKVTHLDTNKLKEIVTYFGCDFFKSFCFLENLLVY